MFITIKFYLQILCVAGYLERRNDTPNLNINKYTNYNIIEIYIKVTGSMYVGNIFLIMCLDMYKNLKRNWNYSGRIKIDHFRESVSF